MTVHWHGRDALRARDPILEVRSAAGVQVLQFGLRLVRSEGRQLPTRAAMIVVPHGRVELACLVEGRDHPLWTRDVETDKAFETIHVGEPE